MSPHFFLRTNALQLWHVFTVDTLRSDSRRSRLLESRWQRWQPSDERSPVEHLTQDRVSPFIPTSSLVRSSNHAQTSKPKCCLLLFPQTVYCWGLILEKELATLTGRAPELCLCFRVLSSSCPFLGRAPELCGWAVWALCPGLVLLKGARNKNVTRGSWPYD